MPNKTKGNVVSQFRINEVLYRKMKFIASEETRSMNNQLEHFIKHEIALYEAEHGEIILPALDEE